MRRITPPRALAILAAGALLTATPGHAQGTGELDELKRELDRALDGLFETIEPGLDSLSRTLETMRKVDSLEHYREPEILPNGDIILRRREDAPPFEPGDEAEPDGPRRMPAPGDDDSGIPL